jgi:dihydrolipoamide dehydrogenase
MTKGRWLLLGGFAALIALFFALGLQRYLTVEQLRASRDALIAMRDAHPVGFSAAYFLVYVVMATLSLPGAGIMTLAGGAIFGVAWGVLLVSFASSIGATSAMLASRFLFHDAVQSRYGDRLKGFNAGFARDGALYLFTLRLTGIPYFLINIVMGLTKIPAWTFYWVSQLGMLPFTFVFIYAGSQLGTFQVSGKLVAAIAALGLLPLLTKKIAEAIKVQKVYARFQKPDSFDRNLIVIGAGSAGLVTAYIAATVKAKVTLIEKHKMGGDCLNTGCVPSKAILRSAKLLDHVRRAREFGLRAAAAEFDFADVMNRVQRVIKTIEPHDSVERYTELGVECLQGHARLVDPWTVQIDGNRKLTAESIVIAAGAEPFVPPIPGLKEAGYYTSDTIWELRVQPKRLIVLGGGPIGSELTQAFARLGSQVTQVEMLPRIMPREDPEIAQMVMERFKAEGIDVRVGTKAKEVRFVDNQKTLICEKDGKEEAIPFDEILVAVGRVARLKGYGLEEVGVETNRVVKVNEYLQTTFPNIYACGDVAGPYQFTHTAAHMAWYCAVNALFGRFKKFKVDYSVIPWATFTEPEVARVGLNEMEAKEKKIPYELTTYPIDDLDRAIADEEPHGVVKVLTVPGKDKILGVTIAGEHAGDIIAEYVLAMRHGLGLNKILGTIHIYPTLAEMNKYAAGNWKKAHKPDALLDLVGKFHDWSRS